VREAELEVLCVDAPADPTGRWAAKDHLAHMAWWRARHARLMDGVRTGGDLPPSVEDDPQNDLIYRASRDRSAADIQAEARRSWDLLAEAVQACSEADLMKPHPYSEGQILWQSVSGTGPGHLAQHLMFWYLESGDEASAEKAQLWASEMDTALAPNEKQRAFATYNLACFYGRVGRAGAAVPLLRESLAAAPELVDWALKDPDLDPIRGDKEIASLLAG
jgi:hypothetical protein